MTAQRAANGASKLAGYRALIHCHIRFPVLFSCARKKEIKPPFYGYSFGVPVCVCECRPDSSWLIRLVVGIKSNKIAKTHTQRASFIIVQHAA